jgi:hypothetical protein
MTGKTFVVRMRLPADEQSDDDEVQYGYWNGPGEYGADRGRAKIFYNLDDAREVAPQLIALDMRLNGVESLSRTAEVVEVFERVVATVGLSMNEKTPAPDADDHG